MVGVRGAAMIRPGVDGSKAKTLWMSYQQGWKNGAAVNAMDERFTQHRDEEIRTAYDEGYRDGRAARGAAMTAACKRYGYEPSPLRLMEQITE